MANATSLNMLLNEFNLSHFRLGQEEIITDVLAGKDVLGILPTGTGKSLCYQLPAKALTGTTIVVSPLIALMLDQVKQLKAKHFKKVVALNSFMDWTERKNTYKKLATYKLIYVSPELLQNEELLYYLTQINVSLFVVDEAHCISQWGHEFRPDYLKLGSVLERLGQPPILALSATATQTVQNDIIETLKRPEIIKHVYPIDRENIAYTIEEVTNDQQKLSIITDILGVVRVPTVIYFSSRRAAENIAHALQVRLSNHRIAFYHGGMEQTDRLMVQQQFMNDQLDIICSTNAFGMGIDKANIRIVIHYHLSSQIESYIQEVGRAGRDGQESLSLLLFNESDIHIPLNLIENELPTQQMIVNTFKILYKIYEYKEVIPVQEEDIEKTFGLNDTQWGFMRYQLEQHNIIRGSTIVYEQSVWKEAFDKIKQLQRERYAIKRSKLTEMVAWIREQGCLRKKLYQSFQPSYTPAQFQCCSNCGFSLEAWHPEQTEVKVSNRAMSWQQKLAELLMIEGDYESK